MLGNKVKVLRGELDLTRKDLAEDLSISYHALSKYETNEREPDIDTIKKLADYFEISIDELLGRDFELSVGKDHTAYDNSRVIIPVFTKLFRGMEQLDKKNIARYEEILINNHGNKKQFFYYIAEDMTLNGYRIFKNDKILFEISNQLMGNNMVLLQVDNSDPMIRMAYFDDEFLILSANSPNIKPKIIARNQIQERIKIIGQMIKVEFIPSV